jgi:hypothetical protein
VDESVIDVELIRNQIKDWEDTFADWKTEAVEAFKFVAGEQWTKEDLDKMEASKRPAVSLNLVASMVRGVCGLEVGNRQEVRYLPREMGDVQANEVLDAAAQWVRDECNAADEESEMFRDLVICGIGAGEIRVCYAEDPAGKVLIERLDPLQVAWDSTARKRGLTDARWVATWKRLPISEIARLWPDADLVDGESEDYDEAEPANEPHDREAARKYQGGTGGTDSSKGIKVTQYQYWQQTTIYRVMGPGGQSMDLPQAKYAVVQPRLAELGVMAKPVQRREYRQAFMAKGQLLEDKVLPVEAFSIHFLTGFRDRAQGCWYGFVRDVREPQRYVNKMYSLGLDILASDAKGGLLAEKSAFENVRQAEEDWANPRKIVWMRDGGIGKVQPRQSSGTPASIERIFQSTIELLPRISGVSMEFLGTTDRTQAGILEHQRKQATITTLAELFSSLTLYRKQSGKVLAEFIVKFLADGRLIRIVGKQKEQYVPLLLQPGALEFDVVVDEMPQASDVKMRTFAVLEQLLPMAVQAGIPIPPSAVDYMPLPSSLASEWKKMLAQPRIPPEVQMQMEQGKALIAQQQSEIQKLKTDQSAKMAQLQADWQKSMAELQMEKENTERELTLKREVANIDAQIQAEKAASDIILQREKFLADYQLKMAEAAAKQDMEALRMQQDQVRAETDSMRSRAESDIAAMVKKLDNVIAMPQGGARKKRKRSIAVQRDKGGRVVGAYIESDDGSGPRKERVAVRRGAGGRIEGADIEDSDD